MKKKGRNNFLILGNIEATEELVKSPGINIEEVDEQKITPLQMACVFNHFQCARFASDLLKVHNTKV